MRIHQPELNKEGIFNMEAVCRFIIGYCVYMQGNTEGT